MLNLIAQQHYNFILKHLSDSSRKIKILDTGCGKGNLTRKLQKCGFDVFACDINDVARLKKPVHFKQVNLNYKLPYKNSSFDVIVCLEVIEHLENPWLLISEFYRMLNDGGKLFISSPNLSNCLARIYYLFSGKLWLFKEHKTDHINPVSYWEIDSILKHAGFKDTILLEGVSVVSEVGMVTNIKSLLVKVIYNLVFRSWNLIHYITNINNDKLRILFKSYSYVIEAHKQ
jgi:SAM-dependent methyltransferase